MRWLRRLDSFDQFLLLWALAAAALIAVTLLVGTPPRPGPLYPK